MLNLEYPGLLDNFRKYLDPKRTESASFLIWYLENYYRLDALEAVDSVCDQRGDKGVDGIYINDNDFTIDVFQSKISQKHDSTIGDTLLKEFYGTLSQFKDEQSIKILIETAGDSEVVRLIHRINLLSVLSTHDIRGIFISNVDIDTNGLAYLQTIPELVFIGKTNLNETYVSDKRYTPVAEPMTFDISGYNISEYIVDTKTKAIIAPLKASELVTLNGISDQSLFAFNVRGPLGRTQVNKDIVKSIKDPSKHKLFPLFHNGITIICETMKSDSDRLIISNYFVVNGCQSLNSLYDNRKSITGDLRVLCKVIKMEIKSSLSEMVTRYSNNQNGVRARDFMSNNPIQIRLQNEFKEHYKGKYGLEIKRGEISSGEEIISNEIAGLYLISFDLKEPWTTHRKYRVFEEKHADIFARPEVTADRILMCHLIIKIIENNSDRINNKLFGKYALTQYILLYIVRTILENDDVGKTSIQKPQEFVRDDKKRAKFCKCIDAIIKDVIVDVNGEVDELGDNFDYRGKLRESPWVKELSKKVIADYLKLVNRNRIESFKTEWNKGVK
jgi:hypothetical protein